MMRKEFEIDFEREQDGRWIAAVEKLPGVLAYGRTRQEAQQKVEALARQVVAAQGIKGTA